MVNELDPKHSGIRMALRIIGPLVFLIGLIFIIVGLVSFFSAFSGGGLPTRFWCSFVGLPLMALGGSLTSLGFMGSVARYQAGEMAPVAKDAFNYMAHGTRDGVREVASAVGEGLRGESGEARTKTLVRCHKCNDENEADAKFCNNCGAALLKSRACAECGELNDPDARFCDNCGGAMQDASA